MSRSVHRSNHVLSQDGDNQAVLLDLAGERYFGLNQVGTRIWQLLGETPSLPDVHARLCAEFDAPPERIQQDLLALVEQLQAAGLITVE
ncbi:PqqD family protein [Thermomonas sp.]|uniref:PqqD family protein n=1 Tax=Thermomonas sp. TaxID=1971895 RepID=UPI0035B29F64